MAPRNTIQNRRIWKFIVLNHYSPGMECVVCGENDFDKLTLDHIVDGTGNTDRLEHGCSKSGCWNAVRFYYNIMRAGFPPLYQVMCRKCNLEKNHRYMSAISSKNKGTEKVLSNSGQVERGK